MLFYIITLHCIQTYYLMDNTENKAKKLLTKKNVKPKQKT